MDCYGEDIYVGYRYFETFAKDRVRFPFGFGMSYTSFDIAASDFRLDGDKVTGSVNVKNTGSAPRQGSRADILLRAAGEARKARKGALRLR